MKKNRLFVLLVCFLLIIIGSFCACGKGEEAFNVVFDLNGGTVITGTTEQKVTSANQIEEPSVARTGYVFSGWDTEISSIKKDATVKALWSACVYSITYNLAGGTETSVNPATYTIETEDFVLSSPEREGFVFAGWSASDSVSPVINYVLRKGSYGNKTFTAVWTPKYYTIEFNANGGAGTMFSISVKAGERKTLPAATFEKPGYSVAGWAYEPNGEMVVIDGGEFLQPAKNVVLYAIWEGKLSYYTVEHYKEDESGEFVLSTRENLSGKAFETATAFSKAFDGYKLNPVKSILEGTIRPDDSLVLRLYYEREIVISFNANGGSGIMDNQILTVSSTNKALNLNAFTKSGYIFKGWSIKPGGFTEYENGASYNKKESVTLYAVWVAGNIVTVNFNLNGGSFNGETNIEPIFLTYGETLGEDYFIPQKEGYVFKEWQAADRVISKDTPLNCGEEITLTAVYTKRFLIKYQLTCTVYYRLEANKPLVSEEVICEYDGNVAVPNEYVLEGNKITIDLSKIKVAAAQKLDFSFSGLYATVNGKSVKITENTVFDIQTFGDVPEITLKVRCKSLYSPNY